MSPEIPKSHPRYASLVTREKLVEGVRAGIVAWEGLLAHGRGEAYDYLLGERTVPEARVAEHAASGHLLRAEHAILSVNGNVALLAAEPVRRLADATGAGVEVNLFHRTEERVAKITTLLQQAGIPRVFGANPDATIPGLDHPRALCSREGLYRADVVLVPLEDGDRAEALVAMGKTMVAIDLNPLSRTNQAATVAIVDEVTRALHEMSVSAETLQGDSEAQEAAVRAYEKAGNLAGIRRRIGEVLA